MADLTHAAKVLAVALPLAGCPTPCDPDCSASCHEAHIPASQRAHSPGFQCGEAQILAAAARRQERERIREGAGALKFTLFRPGNGPAQGSSMDAVPFGELLALIGGSSD